MRKTLSYLFLLPGYASTSSETFSPSPKPSILLTAIISQLSGMTELILWLGLIDSCITPVVCKGAFSLKLQL